jgi:hypothetical protein
MYIGLRAKRNPTAIAASMVGRRERMARVSARCPKAAGKATELGREATRSAVARVAGTQGSNDRVFRRRREPRTRVHRSDSG